jgi:type IV pilus assembly protein PilY1
MTLLFRPVYRIGLWAPMLWVSSALAAPPAPGTVDLIATPPELTATVAPNILVTLDDSGSMGFHAMPDNRPFDNVSWGVRYDQSNVHNNRYDYNTPWLCAAVIDAHNTNPNSPRALPMNGVYYNPNVRYRVPLMPDGVTPFPTPTIAAAWNNGLLHNRPISPILHGTVISDGANASERGARNLLTARFCTSSTAAATLGPAYYRLKDGITLTLDAQGQVTNTTVLYNAANWDRVPVPPSQYTNFAIWWSYYHTRALTAATAMTLAMSPFDKNVRIAWQNLNLTTNQASATTPIYAFENQPFNSNVRDRFYNWLYNVTVGGGTPTLDATIRAGRFFNNEWSGRTGASDRNPYWDRELNRELSCRQNFHFNVSDGFWNQPPPATSAVNPRDTTPSPQTLPDGKVYTVSAATLPEARIFYNENGANTVSLADIAWRYWSTVARPDFQANASTRNKVVPFLPDRSTNLFGPPLAPGQNAIDHKEIYWNPANNPATWTHMVNFMVSFGVFGTIPQNPANLQALRLGGLTWPATSANTLPNIDDMWHAAINSRGRFFASANADDLIRALQEVVANILARRAGATATAVSLPLITDGTTGYSAGFDSADWSGFLTRDNLDPSSGQVQSVQWDAGCLLTGGACATTATTVTQLIAPDDRRILTTDGGASSLKPFRWSNLNTQQRAALNTDPVTLRLDLGVINLDGRGELRVNYLRGDRTHETTASPRFRVRSSLLGSVIKGQPVYVSSPTAGYRDADWPETSREYDAAINGAGYREFQNDNFDRPPTVYVGSNNGMLHAFNAETGRERFAFVPNTLIRNYRLTQYTQHDGPLVPGVDEKPVVTDAFINGAWRTVLVGALRLGGRGVFALDITDPDNPQALWEFSNLDPGAGGTDCAAGARFCSSLGYTYESANITRLPYDDRWVALVSSGYFPTDTLDPASQSPKAGQTSLLVIDLATGQLIREIRTSTAPQFTAGTRTFGLSQAIVYDIGSDQIGDVAIAGDLAGNLWRFDLSATDPADWSVDLMFQSYGSGGAAAVGDQPIASAPVVMRDRARRTAMFVFGTGKFIGLPDRVSSIPQQSFYGLRDYGTCDPLTAGSDPDEACNVYPIVPSDLVVQSLSQAPSGARTIPSPQPIPEAKRGWRIRLNIPSEPGERSSGIPFPFYAANLVLLRTVIPESTDPCDPGARYGFIFVNADTGTAPEQPSAAGPTPPQPVGGVLSAPRPISDPVARVGGGDVVLIGLPPGLDPALLAALKSALSQGDSVWHRNSWRELSIDR